MYDDSPEFLLIYKKDAQIATRTITDTKLGEEQFPIIPPVDKAGIDSLNLTENELAVFCSEPERETCVHLATIPYSKPVSAVLQKLTAGTDELRNFRLHVDSYVAQVTPKDYVVLVYGRRDYYYGRVMDRNSLGEEHPLPAVFRHSMSNVAEDIIPSNKLVVFFIDNNVSPAHTVMMYIAETLASKVVTSTLTTDEHKELFLRINKLQRSILAKSAAAQHEKRTKLS